jgi:hypothetical protein
MVLPTTRTRRGFDVMSRPRQWSFGGRALGKGPGRGRNRSRAFPRFFRALTMLIPIEEDSSHNTYLRLGTTLYQRFRDGIRTAGRAFTQFPHPAWIGLS